MRNKTIIADTPVRIQILNALLKESIPLSFSEIAEIVNKHDATIGRELKYLVDKELIIKESRGVYSLNKNSQEYANIFRELALKGVSDNFTHIINDGKMDVFIASEELDTGLIDMTDIYSQFKNDIVKRFTNCVEELIFAKVWAVLRKEIDTGMLQREIMPFEKINAHIEEITMKPCKIIITYNTPFFKAKSEEKE